MITLSDLRRVELDNLLRRLGVTRNYVGRMYLMTSVEMVINDCTLLQNITKGLYPMIAKMYNTTVNSVERNIRTVGEIIWLKGNYKLLEEVFGYELPNKPSNGELIDSLAYYIESRTVN